MTPDQIVRAWKDADYGATLPLAEAAVIPAHPVGTIELTDDALGLVAGGNLAGTHYMESLGCCKGFTQAGYCDVTLGYPVCTMHCLTIFWTGFC